MLTPHISVLTRLCTSACSLLLHTCSLSEIAHVAKCLLFGSSCVDSLPPSLSLSLTHTQTHIYTHLCVDLSVNAVVQPSSPYCLTDPFISCGGRNEPTLPAWTDLTERDYFKACMDFLACPLLPIPIH